MHAHAAAPPSAAQGFLDFLDSEAGGRFLADFQTVELPRSTLVCTPGDTNDRVLIVRSGRVRVYLADADRELTLAFLEPGDAFSTHTPTYIATVAPTVLHTLPTRRFAAKLAAQPEATPTIMRVLGKLLGGSIELIESLVFRDATSRLAHFLARITRHQGSLVGEQWIVPFSWSLADLALLLGTTRQTVSEVVNQLEREGVFERRGRRLLIVHDLAALEGRGRASNRSKTAGAQASASRRTRPPSSV
jgi:CRP/FNR family transcriptional regulator, carbon monoxide oxidation system transcription regulator